MNYLYLLIATGHELDNVIGDIAGILPLSKNQPNKTNW